MSKDEIKEPKKKGLVIAISIIITLLLIAGGVFAYLYFTTDIFKSNEQLFYEYLGKVVDEELLAENEKVVPNFSGKSVNSGTASFDTYFPELDKLKLTWQGENDPDSRKAKENVNLFYDNENLFELKYLKDTDTIALKSDEIVNRFLGFENNNLKDFAKKIGVSETLIEQIPDKIDLNMTDIYSKDEIPEQVLKNIQDRYIGIIRSKVDKQSYKKESNVVIKDDLKDVTTDVYMLELTDSKMKEILTEILNTMKVDEELKNAFVTDVESFDEAIDSFITSAEDLEENGDKIIYKCYVANKKLIKLEVESDLITVGISTKVENDKNIIHVSAISSEEDVKVNADIEWSKTKNEGKITYEITMEEITLALEIELNEMIDTASKSIKDTITFNLKLNGINNKLNVENTVKYVDSVNIESLDENNCVKINDLSVEEMEAIFEQLGNRIAEVYNQKLQQIGIGSENT